VASGLGGVISAPEIDITGTPGTSGNGTFSGTIYNGQVPTPDPYAFLPEPTSSSLTLQSKNPTHIAGSNTVHLSPGVYQGGISCTGQGTVNMDPGIYYMDGGGFSFTGQGNLNASGVLIFNAPKSNSDVININGSGSINFSPLTTGAYAGFALWQARSATNTITVSGNGNSNMSGTFYTAHGTLNVSGNGNNDVIGSQYISYDLLVNGGGTFKVNWTADKTGHTRSFGLVE
jgi:hypothetical protein